jgi:acetyl-CoA acyltransferase
MSQFPMKVPVASALRTAVGRGIKGTLKDTRPDDFAAEVVKASVAAVDGLKGDEVEDLILGCAMPEAEQGLNVARSVVFLADLPHTVSAETINRFCSSGLQAIAHGAMAIQCGLRDVVVAGGVESMSLVPMGGNKVRLNPKLVDEYPEAYIAMGHTAERVAKQFDVDRGAQDAFAASSHAKAVAAYEKKLFDDEIVTVQARSFADGKPIYNDFNKDELVRPDTTVESLAKLRPAFSASGIVTAGNSSPLSDGAASTVLMSEKKASDLGVKPLAYMRAFTTVGVPPEIMGIGPKPAIEQLLKMVDMKVEDIDLFEINEAFAAQAVYCQRELGISDDKINVNGGAIALGHPLGATGAKLSATLLHELKRRGGKYGIVSMCIGGGMGAAGLFEMA